MCSKLSYIFAAAFKPLGEVARSVTRRYRTVRSGGERKIHGPEAEQVKMTNGEVAQSVRAQDS